jgi:hypothetical protein
LLVPDLPAPAGSATIAPTTTTTAATTAAESAATATTTAAHPTSAATLIAASRWIQADDVLRSRTFLTLDDIELDLLALVQRLEARSLDRAVVDEYVLATFPSDEAETLLGIEPLHRATDLRHVVPAAEYWCLGAAVRAS